MRLKTKQYAKLAVTSLVAAFSFGLAISCVSNHKQNINKVFAEDDISTTWSYNPDNKALTCTSASNYPNGFIMETNQVGVRGAGNGQYELAYQVLGYPGNVVEDEYTDYGIFTVVFISGFYDSTSSTDGPYGSITAYPLDVSGLDSDTEYEINIKVEPTGDMNEQNSGTGTTEPDGTWTLTDGSLKFQFTDWQTNGYVSETNQIMVHGNGDGTFEIGYELRGDPPGATSAGSELLAEKTIQLIDGYWTPSETGGYGTVTGFPVNVNGLDSGVMITLNINVQYSGTMNEQGSGEGDDENAGTWTWNENTQKLSFQFNDTATAGYVSTTSQTMVYGHGNGTYEIRYDLYGTPGNATVASNELLASKTIRLYDGYFNEDAATVTGNSSEVAGLESYGQITVTVDVAPSGDLNTDGWRVNDGQLYFYVLADENPASIDSITWNNSSGNGTGEAILSVTISTNGGSFQQVYQINYPTFNPELEGTSGTTLGNTTVEGISEWSDREVTIDISNVTYSLGESTQEVRYTITYYPNFADGEPTNDFTDYVLEGDTAEYMLLENMFSRADYVFLGWSTDSSSQTPSYEEGEKVYLRSDISYYAIWEYQEPQEPDEIRYTITYYPNGAVGDTFERYTDYTSGDSSGVNYTFESCPEDYYMEGCYFAGWSTSEGGQEPEYNAGEPYTVNRDLNVYAVWVLEQQEPETQPEVTSIEVTKSSSSSYYVGDLIDFQNITVVAKYSDGTTRELTSDEYVAYLNPQADPYEPLVAGDYALYFTYEGVTNEKGVPIYVNQRPAEEIRYTIRYFPNGDDVGSFEEYTGSVSGDSLEVSYQFAEMPEEFYKEGYRFAGWSTNPDETIAAEYLPNETYSINSDLEVYPVWIDESSGSDVYSYEIIFVANNGTSDTQTNPFTLPESSTTYDLPSIEQVGFTRDGYSFVGWSYSSDGEVLKDAPVIESGTTTTFYAIWELVGPRYQYTITFDGNGATSGSTDSVILSGDDYSQTIVFPVCGYEREGYIFKGWGFNSEAIMTYKAGEERTDITSDTTFYAIWTQLFTISFDANGGEGMMENITIPQGNATMPECAFTREGYSFAGWAVGSPTGDVYQTGASVYVSANYVLYATWEPITPITEIDISVAESEVVLYVDDSYIVQHTVTPEDAAGELIWKVENEKVAAVIEDGMLVGLNVGTTTVTISDRSGNTSVSFVVYVVEKPVPVQPENPISEETIENISNAMDNMELSEEQTEKIQNVISENQEYISDEAGDIIYQALLGTTISSDDPVVAEAQKELVVAVVEAGVAVDAGKATNISGAQTIDKALPENVNFSVEGEIQEFYERQMAELFGGEKPRRSLSRAGTPTHGIDTDTKGKEGQEAVDYLANEQLLYKKMGDFVESGVDHMGKAALKLRKCSGEAVTVQVKNYVTRVKVSSFREFDKEAADKEFVEAAYKAILLSMQNEVISILEKEHKPSNNAEKEAQYTKELEAVKDIESFEIMVTEVLRQKYVALTGENIEDVDAFHPIYWEIFSAWALDKQSPYPITLEELTQTTIDQSTSRARAFTINSDLTGGEWGFIAGIIAGSAAIITAAAVIPTVLKKRRAKEGNK